MKLLLDHCVPQRFALLLSGHEVSLASQQNWEALRNGRLLAVAASAGFEAMVTVDRNIQYQPNLAKLPLAVVVLRAVSNDLDNLAPLVPALLKALLSLSPRTYIEVGAEA